MTTTTEPPQDLEEAPGPVAAGTEVVGPSPPVRGGDGRSSLLLAGAVFVPFVVLVLRVVLLRQTFFLSGDTGLLDVEVLRALHFQQLLGPYDRYGWHHPGPMYPYLISFVDGGLGALKGAQSQAVVALLINGLSIAGVVYVLGRLRGPRAATVSGVILLLTVFGIGPSYMLDPWNPYVVLMPLALFGCLLVCAALGSPVAFAAAAFVGTFDMQTDVGTVPIVVVGLVVALASLVAVRRRKSGPMAPLFTSGVVALGGITVLCWVPVVYQQFFVSPGNLSAIASFMLHAQDHPSMSAGGSAAGVALAWPLGAHLSAPATNMPAWLGSQLNTQPDRGLLAGLVVAAAVFALVWIGRRMGDRTVQAFAIAGLIGGAMALFSGLAIVGPAYSFLMFWARGVTIFALLGYGLLLVRWLRAAGRRAGAVAVVALLATSVALTVWAATTPKLIVRVGSTQSTGKVWSAVAPVLRTGSREVVGVSFDNAGLILATGVADQLAEHDVAFTVPAQWNWAFGPGTIQRSTERLSLTEPGAVPAGFHVVTTVDGVAIAYDPSGTKT